MHEVQLQNRLGEFRDRYLRRTLKEVSQLHELLGRCRAGMAEALREMEVITHRIRGSGAMLGFPAISEAAAALERLTAEHVARQSPIGDVPLADCEKLLHQLEMQATSAVEQARLEI